MIKWLVGILFAIIVGMGIGLFLDMNYKEIPAPTPPTKQNRQFHLNIQFHVPDSDRVHQIEIDSRNFGGLYGGN